ncbi:hypothetical protein SK128_002648 [Halocaridina rubra]|uniref:Alcohol dehydrogenase n=1 Tax=Halocaridina rubra TaxID=373956 RepID=A0AAN8W8Z8_HALRR
MHKNTLRKSNSEGSNLWQEQEMKPSNPPAPLLISNRTSIHFQLVGDSHIRNIFEVMVKRMANPRLLYRVESFDKDRWEEARVMYKRKRNYFHELYHEVIHLDIPLKVTYRWEAMLQNLPSLLESWISGTEPRPTLLLFGTTLHFIARTSDIYFKYGPQKAAQNFTSHLKLLTPFLSEFAKTTMVVYKMQDHIQHLASRVAATHTCSKTSTRGYSSKNMSSTKGKVIRCRAAVAWEKNKPMTIEEVEVSPPKAKEIRVRIVASGICHSDLSALAGILPFVRFPTVLGHEGGGIVESVGSEVTSVKEGDHILTSFLAKCNECIYCKSTRTNLCIRFLKTSDELGYMHDGTTRFSCKGKELYHFVGCSTFTEYTVLDDHQFSKVNKGAPLDKICILGCGVTAGYGTPVKLAQITPGSTCAVFGLGAVGLGAVMGCKVRGAATIIGVDINNDKKTIAQKFGVTDFCNPNDSDKPIQEVLKEMTQKGCDFTFECVGNTAVIESALEAARPGTGKCVITGAPPKGQKLSIDPYQLLFGRVLTGCFLGGFTLDEVSGLVEDYLKTKIMVDEFITLTKSFEEANEAFDILRQGKTLKIVLKV